MSLPPSLYLEGVNLPCLLFSFFGKRLFFLVFIYELWGLNTINFGFKWLVFIHVITVRTMDYTISNNFTGEC